MNGMGAAGNDFEGGSSRGRRFLGREVLNKIRLDSNLSESGNEKHQGGMKFFGRAGMKSLSGNQKCRQKFSTMI